MFSISFENMLKIAVDEGASDLHIAAGSPPVVRKNGKLLRIGDIKITPKDSESMIRKVLGERFETLESIGELDMPYTLLGIGRFRINAFRQRGSYGMAARLITFGIPTLEELMLPPVLREFTKKTKGLILVTGPTGSGKSTTLASMLNIINNERSVHILTLEDPIEYLHKHARSIVNQREIGVDTKSYANALRAALREDPDVILIGEMRDVETIGIALTAAETGHLVFSTLHTTGAAKTIDRIIDVFPSHQQQQVRVQMASSIQAIVSQQLLPKVDGSGRVAAIEIMISTPAIRSMIREGKIHQLDSVIQTNSSMGMQSMDMSLMGLYNRQLIGYDEMMAAASSNDNIMRMIGK